MKRRLLALFLIATLVLALSPAAAAADTRDTDFFTPREHAELNFSEMTYVPTDVDAVLARMDAVRALAADKANAAAVESGFLECADDLSMSVTMYILTAIYSSMDYTDVAAAERELEAYQNAVLVKDGLNRLIRDILLSPCASALDAYLSEDERAFYSEYEEITNEELALANQQSALESEYWRLAGQDYSAEYGGKVWTNALAEEANFIGELDDEAYVAVLQAIAKEKNTVLGAHYLKMVELNKQVALTNGYSDFADYAYELLYQRDYTKEDIREFYAGVKEEIVPVRNALVDLYLSRLVPLAEPFGWDYAGDVALNLMEPYVALLSDEMYESFRYMRDHGLYDSGWNDLKTDQGYTTELLSYAAPFFFNAPYGGPEDLSTAIHEFGHYNNAYWTDPGWYQGDKPLDICEVHSQALELLFTKFYPEFFGEYSDDMLVRSLYSIITASIINGALYDELQQYVYATPGVTLEQINRKYCRLCREYGVIEPDDPRTEMYGWVDVSHSFVSPFYYISYAVSAAGAFAFWLEAQDDYFAAVDDYLRFTALDLSYGFQDSFAAIGATSPLSREYLANLCTALLAAVDGISPLPFTDVDTDDWFYDYVEASWAHDLMGGTSLKSFSPGATMTRAMAVTVLYRIDGEEELEPGTANYSDVPEGIWYEDAVRWADQHAYASGYSDGRFGPDDPITRQDLAAILYRYAQDAGLGFEGFWFFPLDNPDADQIADYADVAMHWMVMNGVIGGREDGTLAPVAYTTRAECAKILTDFILVLLAEAE